MPPTPAAPAMIEPAWNEKAGATESVYTGIQQFMDWGAGPSEISLTMPPLIQFNGQAFVAFLEALLGQVNYFTFNAAFLDAYPEILLAGSPPTPRYWRLKTNQRKWQIPKDRNYRITFDCREAF